MGGPQVAVSCDVHVSYLGVQHLSDLLQDPLVVDHRPDLADEDVVVHFVEGFLDVDGYQSVYVLSGFLDVLQGRVTGPSRAEPVGAAAELRGDYCLVGVVFVTPAELPPRGREVGLQFLEGLLANLLLLLVSFEYWLEYPFEGLLHDFVAG